jgi:hypothetical protein
MLVIFEIYNAQPIIYSSHMSDIQCGKLYLLYLETVTNI